MSQNFEFYLKKLNQYINCVASKIEDKSKNLTKLTSKKFNAPVAISW